MRTANLSMYVLLKFVLVCYAVNNNTRSERVIRGGEVIKDLCNKTVEIYEDVVSQRLSSDNYGKPLTCWYKFRSFKGTSSADWVLRIRFKRFKFGTLVNATTCIGGYMQIHDGNPKTLITTHHRRNEGTFCGEIEQMQTYISETSFVKILFYTDNFTDETYYSFDTRAEQEHDLYRRLGKHPELYPNRRGYIVPGTYCQRIFKDCRLQTCYVQSPAYPGVYLRGLHCSYQLTTKSPYIKLYIENEEFNVDGQRCENTISCPMRTISTGAQACPYDYIRVYDGADALSREIGTFCGMGKFPYSIIGTTQHLYVEFVTSPAGPLLNTGFHFTVGSWPGRVESFGVHDGSCNWVMKSTGSTGSSSRTYSDDDGSVHQPAASGGGGGGGVLLSIVHWYPPHTRCTYLLQGRPEEVVRLHFPSLRVGKVRSPIAPFDGDCGESLTIYDSSSPDDSKILKTFCDTFSRPTTKQDYVSTGSSMFVRFESKTGSYSGSSLYYWAYYDFYNNTKFGTPVRGTDCDEEFTSWSKKSGWLRSPLNALVYKKFGNADTVLRCRYKFITDYQTYSRIMLSIQKVNFEANPSYPQSVDVATCTNCWKDNVDKLLVWEPHRPAMTTLFNDDDDDDDDNNDNNNNNNNSSISSNNSNSSSSNSNSDSDSDSDDDDDEMEKNITTAYAAGDEERTTEETLVMSSSRRRIVMRIGGSGAWEQPPVAARVACICSNGSSSDDGSNDTTTVSQTMRRSALTVTVVSNSDTLLLDMVLNANYAFSRYFKRAASSIFEANYEFVHEPICGPSLLEAADEGELQFPNYDIWGGSGGVGVGGGGGFVADTSGSDGGFANMEVHCVWDIKVKEKRDVSFYFEIVSFLSVGGNCDRGRLSVYLPMDLSRPFVLACGHNVTSVGVRFVSYKDLILPSPPYYTASTTTNNANYSYFQVRFVGFVTFVKPMIKVMWNELYHLKRT